MNPSDNSQPGTSTSFQGFINPMTQNSQPGTSTSSDGFINPMAQTEHKMTRETELLENKNFRKVQFKHPLFISLDGTVYELLKKHNKVMGIFKESIYEQIRDDSLPGTILWTGTNAIKKTYQPNKPPTYAQEFLYGYKRYFALFSDLDNEEDDYERQRKYSNCNNENICHKWKFEIPPKREVIKICRLCGDVCAQFVCVKKNVIIKLVAVHLPITFVETTLTFPLGLCQNCDDDLDICASFLMTFLNIIFINKPSNDIKCLACNDSNLGNLSVAQAKTLKKLVFMTQAIPSDLPVFYSGQRYLCGNCNSIINLHENLLESICSTNLIFDHGYHALFHADNMKTYLDTITRESVETHFAPIRFIDNGVEELQKKALISNVVEESQHRRGFFSRLKQSVISVFRPICHFSPRVSRSNFGVVKQVGPEQNNQEAELLLSAGEEVKFHAENKELVDIKLPIMKEPRNITKESEQPVLESEDTPATSVELQEDLKNIETNKPKIENSSRADAGDIENLTITCQKLLNFQYPRSSACGPCPRTLSSRFQNFERSVEAALESKGLLNLTCKSQFHDASEDSDLENLMSSNFKSFDFGTYPNYENAPTTECGPQRRSALRRKPIVYQKSRQIDTKLRDKPVTSSSCPCGAVQKVTSGPDNGILSKRRSPWFLQTHKVEFKTGTKPKTALMSQLGLDDISVVRKPPKYTKGNKINADYKPSTSRAIQNYQKVPLEPIVEIIKSTPLDSEDED